MSGTVTPYAGSATNTADTCSGTLAVGTTFTVTVKYQAGKIQCTDSTNNYAYTGIVLSLVSNAQAVSNFTQNYTVTGVPLCDNTN